MPRIETIRQSKKTELAVEESFEWKGSTNKVAQRKDTSLGLIDCHQKEVK
jgi:hypothetical protein